MILFVLCIVIPNTRYYQIIQILALYNLTYFICKDDDHTKNKDEIRNTEYKVLIIWPQFSCWLDNLLIDSCEQGRHAREQFFLGVESKIGEGERHGAREEGKEQKMLNCPTRTLEERKQSLTIGCLCLLLEKKWVHHLA